MRLFFAGLIVALIVLHQDYWQWDKSDLVFGFVPYSLAYHVALSLVTAAVWLAVVRCCWPVTFDQQDGEQSA